MSDESPHDPDVFEEIRREHEALREKLGQIHHALEQGDVQGDKIAASLSELRDAVEIHFDNEEQAGFFDEITTHAPRLKPNAKRLCSEHQEMLSTISDLAQSASTGTRSAAWQRELKARFQAFSKQLMHHESDENALLQQAYQEDIGAHD